MADCLEPLAGKRIVLVFGNLELGGAERQGLLLADYLQKECMAKVQVVGLSSTPGRLSELCDELGIPWSGVDFHWGLRRRVPSFLRGVRALKATRPDILISYTRVPNMVCALAWKLIGARLCVWNQADEGLLMSRMPHYRLAVNGAHCFISNSTGGKKFLVETYGKSPEDVHVIYNGITAGVPAVVREQWRSDLDVPVGALVACMIANLSAYKDHATLVRAWKHVVDQVAFDVPPVLVLGGRFDGEEQPLSELAGQLGIAHLVRMPGKIDDVPGLLAASDVFVYSSRSEGIPNAVLEAMAAGVPVVGTDIPGIREALGSLGDGYLSPVGDSINLAEKIITLLQDQALRENLGRLLQARLRQEFSLEDMCRETAELICISLKLARKP